MLIGSIVKETADTSRFVADLSPVLDPGETILSLTSVTASLGTSGWSTAPNCGVPYDPTPLVLQSATIVNSGTGVQLFVNSGTGGNVYTAQFVAIGSSGRRWTIEVNVQLTGPVPIPPNTGTYAASGSLGNGYLATSGGTLYGPVLTYRDPQSAMEVANKEYVDTVTGGFLSSINAETTRAETAEAGLQTSINNETTRATAAEAALLADINVGKTLVSGAGLSGGPINFAGTTVVSGTLTADWHAGQVAVLQGASVNATTHTLVTDWHAGTVAALDTTLTIQSGGTLHVNGVASTAMQPVVTAVSTGAAMTALGIPATIQGVVTKTTVQGALNALAAGGAVTNAPTVSFAPQGNPTATLGSFVLTGTTGAAAQREFLFAANLYSNTGSASGGGGVADKVAVYAGIEGVAGSTDIWAVNSLTAMDAGFPSTAFALGYELDFNNFAQDRGTAFGWPGFSGATAKGLLVTGASTHLSTSGISVEGNNATQWVRGVSVVNASQVAFFDWNQATYGFLSQGTHTYGIDLQPMVLNAGGQAIRVANGGALAARNNANTADLPLIYANTVDNINIGGPSSSGVFIGSLNLVPASDNTTALGGPSLRWNGVWSTNGVIQTSDPTLKTNLQPLPDALPIVTQINPITFQWLEGGVQHVDATVTQTVHATEMETGEEPDVQVVDGRAVQSTRTVQREVHLYDYLPMFDAAGNPVMLTVAAQDAKYDDAGNLTRPATPERTFQKTHQVPRMVQKAVTVKNPVTVPGKRTHWGFSADDIETIKDLAGRDFGGFVKDVDGTKHIRPDQLVAILWKAVQELSAKVTDLEGRVAPTVKP